MVVNAEWTLEGDDGEARPAVRRPDARADLVCAVCLLRTTRAVVGGVLVYLLSSYPGYRLSRVSVFVCVFVVGTVR